MNKVEMVRSTFNLDNPYKSASFTDDFRWTDSVGSPPANKETWLGMAKMMQAAIPDLKYIVDDIGEKGDGVAITGHWSGTFTNDFDMSAMGMGVIPATGLPFVTPASTAQVSFSGDKISAVHDEGTGPDAGLPGLLKALGVSES